MVPPLWTLSIATPAGTRRVTTSARAATTVRRARARAEMRAGTRVEVDGKIEDDSGGVWRGGDGESIVQRMCGSGSTWE